jgi:hypothetical protein
VLPEFTTGLSPRVDINIQYHSPMVDINDKQQYTPTIHQPKPIVSQWQCCRNISTGQNFDRRSASISGPALPTLFPNRPLRNMACTPLYLFLTCHGNPSQWTTCRTSRPPNGEMTVFFWLLITFLRWKLWRHARRESQ